MGQDRTLTVHQYGFGQDQAAPPLAAQRQGRDPKARQPPQYGQQNPLHRTCHRRGGGQGQEDHGQGKDQPVDTQRRAGGAGESVARTVSVMAPPCVTSAAGGRGKAAIGPVHTPPPPPQPTRRKCRTQRPLPLPAPPTGGPAGGMATPPLVCFILPKISRGGKARNAPWGGRAPPDPRAARPPIERQRSGRTARAGIKIIQ